MPFENFDNKSSVCCVYQIMLFIYSIVREQKYNNAGINTFCIIFIIALGIRRQLKA